MQAGYSVTKWPYFRLVDLQNASKDCSEQIEELKKQGKITVENGINCELVKLIKYE